MAKKQVAAGINGQRFRGLDLNKAMPRERMKVTQRFQSVEMKATVRRLQISDLYQFQESLKQ